MMSTTDTANCTITRIFRKSDEDRPVLYAPLIALTDWIDDRYNAGYIPARTPIKIQNAIPMPHHVGFSHCIDTVFSATVLKDGKTSITRTSANAKEKKAVRIDSVKN